VIVEHLASSVERPSSCEHDVEETMSQEERLTDRRLTTPRAAAIAGILFAVLLIISMVLIRISIPADPLEPGGWLERDTGRVSLALNLVPFAGIAFLWFIGVLRDRIGEHEDRFFATVFFGSGVLFLAMLFASAPSQVACSPASAHSRRRRTAHIRSAAP